MNRIVPQVSPTISRTLVEFALALALFTLPVAFAVRYTATSASWWERGFERYDATRRTGLTQAEVLRVAAETREYLRNDDERLNVAVDGEPFYSEREILHMIDVKRLMARTYDAGWAALGYIVVAVLVVGLLAARRNEGKFADGARSVSYMMLRACGFVALLVVALAIIAVAGFDSAFREFHELFFTNDLWRLSSRDRLIQLFPQRFFFDTALLIGAATFAFVVGAGALSAVTLRATRRRRSLE